MPRSTARCRASAAVFGFRAGHRTTGGLRFAFGAAAEFGDRAASGVYMDLEGEIAQHVGDRLELFLDLAIVNHRWLTYRTPMTYQSAWDYGNFFILPFMATAGLRMRL